MKPVLKKLAYHSGLFRISSWLNQDVITIVFYHSFSPPGDKNNLINSNTKHLSTEEFEKHLQLISRYCTPIPLAQALKNKKLPSNPVVVTFDDGYKNNYTHAFPLLKKYQVPAAIFVTTGFIDQTCFLWTDRLRFIIENAQIENSDLQWEDNKLILQLNTDKQKKKTFRTIKNYLKALPESKKQSFLDRLQQCLEIEYDWDKIPSLLKPLSWHEIREMKDSGLISFGAHTVTHAILSRCTYEQQRRELMYSQQRITEELNEPCTLFAYPNGQEKDYNQDTINLLKELGFLGAVTTVAGYIEQSNKNNFQLNRFGYESTVEDMAILTSGIYHLIGKF